MLPPLLTLGDVLQVVERMEELRSMLGWILVHWRAKKQQWIPNKSRQESSQDNIYSEADMCSPFTEVTYQTFPVFKTVVKISTLPMYIFVNCSLHCLL